MKKEFIKRLLSTILLIPLALYFILKGSYFFTFFLLVCFLISIYEWSRITKKNNFFPVGFIFLVLSFLSANILRVSNNDDYYTTFLVVIIICISTDIGGYIFGKLFKGPKLTKISPKKTYSGVIGGYLLSIIFLNLFIGSSYYFSPQEMNSNYFILILLISTVSQLGDIIISYFKRLSKIKDTGKLIPGHGGLLDRIDGMIFAFPFCYGIFSYFN